MLACFPDPYPLLRPFLFLMDAEAAHRLTVVMLKSNLMPRLGGEADPLLHTRVAGLEFPSPVGLAAGFDKHAEIIGPIFNLGFGSVEVGSITPKPQPGNPQPRLFRAREAEAVINRFGFNSEGFDACLQRIRAWQSQGNAKGILGVNIGKNKESPDAAADYAAGVKLFAPFADYLTVNLSSPNTPGLRDLQAREAMSAILKAATEARAEVAVKTPIFVKIAPDLDDAQMNDIAEVVMGAGIDGLIIGNTTLSRPDGLPAEFAKETGGLSGRPLYKLSTEILAKMYRLTSGKIPLIGCGGIGSGEDAYRKIRAGASLVQLYSALIYQGPLLVNRINRELAGLLRRDGFKSVADAVGSHHR